MIPHVAFLLLPALADLADSKWNGIAKTFNNFIISIFGAKHIFNFYYKADGHLRSKDEKLSYVQTVLNSDTPLDETKLFIERCDILKNGPLFLFMSINTI